MRTETVRCDMCGADVMPGDMHGSYACMTEAFRSYDLCAVCCRIVEGVITGDANKIVSVVKMGDRAEKAQP